MATGDSTDILARLRSLLPPWFPSATPVLDAVLSGSATAFAWIYGRIAYVKAQTRLATTTGPFLDLASHDYFGFGAFLRKTQESDATYRGRIEKELFRPRQTRAAITQALTDLTGRTPLIFEPWNPNDCGAIELNGTFAFDNPAAGFYGYGCWGDTNAQYQAFVTAYRPLSTGLPNSSGFDIGLGGLDIGNGMALIDMAAFQPAVSDADILACVRATQAAGVTCWTAILSNPPNPAITSTLDFSTPANSALIAAICSG